MARSRSRSAPMSITTWCTPRAGARISRSISYVAPCRFCAGPKNRSAKLCAIITWSETPSVNMGSFVVEDRLDGIARGSIEARVDRRSIREGAGLGHEHVQGRIKQERSHQLEATGDAPARRARGRQGRHL